MNLLEKYTEEEIDHFSYFAFQDGAAMRWCKDIRLNVSHDENISDEILNHMHDCINQINELAELITIKLVDSNHNVCLTFVDSLIPGKKGFTRRYFDEDVRLPWSIDSAVLVISTVENDHLNSTIYHEFGHLLGFNHNQDLNRESGWTYKSLFNQSSTTYVDSLWDFVPDFTEFSDLDKAAIRIMYDKDVGIDPGLTKRKFFRMIEKAKKEMGYDDPVVGGG